MQHASATSDLHADGPQKKLSVRVIALPIKAVRLKEVEIGVPTVLTDLASHGVLPVLGKRRQLQGVVLDRDLLLSFDAGLSIRESPTLRADQTVEEALALFGSTEQGLIPIIDNNGRYTGQCASRTQLWKLLNGMLRPARVGGLATPLGVFMTSGRYTSGAGFKGIVATGVMFGLLTFILEWVSWQGFQLLAGFAPRLLLSLGEGNLLVLQMGALLFSMLGLLRLSPLSGLHAAEHMTINAIERDLAITESNVRQQPREHARCGTNLMVFLGGIQLMLFFLLSSLDRLSPLGLALYAMLWSVVILRFWRPVGLWIQRHFTTKPPSKTQLQSGLRAGEELLAKFSDNPHPFPTPWERLWGSGLIHMLLSFMITLWVVGLLLDRLGLSV